ncbi:MAG: hypothetical protein O2856_01580 [Planctomycetota bacterium]|nr:hypothetical protein [Planctomycetota bacterium]
MAAIDPELNWSALLDTVTTAQKCCEQWMDRGKLTRAQAEEIIADLQAQFGVYSQEASTNAAMPKVPGFLPQQSNETAGVRGYRAALYVNELLHDLRSRGKITLSQFHGLKADSDERLLAVRRRLQREQISEASLAAQCNRSNYAEPARANTSARSNASATSASAAATEPETKPPAVPRRSLLEIILDPRSIQCLLGLGGALMVVGLVILLWLNDYFTPPVLAMILAFTNVVLLAAGLATIRYTRYQLAGKALSLLSCFVMPLNLWYCHSNGLVTIDGHLWMCAVLISALYAVAAVMLKDELFVYVFSAGVAMTGLMFLADLQPSPARFWEIASPATMLVVLGLIGIHLQRAFLVGEGPFTRGRFGMAFFWAGHFQLAVGLILLLAAQVAGDWLYPFWFKPVYEALHTVPSPVCNSLRWLALVLVIAGTYGYVYSDLAVRKRGIFIHIAAFTLLWAEVLIVQILNLELGVDAIIAILAVTSLLSHLTHHFLSKDNPYTRSLPVFGLLLGLLPALMGVVVYLDHFGLQSVWADEAPRWAFVGAMLLTAVACRVGAHLYRHVSPSLMTGYFFATGASTMVAAVAALAALGLNQWQSHAPIMMLIPIAYLIAAKLYGEHSPAKPLLWVAHTSAGVMLISSLASAFEAFGGGTDKQTLHLSLALFFAEAAAFYGIATYFRRQPLCVYLSSFMATAAFWQVLAYFALGTQAYILVFAVVGLGMLMAYRMSLLEQTAAAPLAEALFQSANAVLSLAFIASVFYALSRIANEDVPKSSEVVIHWTFAGYCLAMLGISMLAILITQHPAGRRWYVVTTVGQAVVLLLAVHKLIELNPWQQVELFAVLIGLILLGIGHYGWYKEQDQHSDLVSMSLLFGAILASVPLAIATWIDRGQNVFYPVNEFGFLFISVGLLATGILFQLKSTTMIGSAMTALYFVTLLIFVPWSRLNAVALAITIGGGTIFGFGLVLAFFRDRLLALPERIKQREGVFRVFNWR